MKANTLVLLNVTVESQSEKNSMLCCCTDIQQVKSRQKCFHLAKCNNIDDQIQLCFSRSSGKVLRPGKIINTNTFRGEIRVI